MSRVRFTVTFDSAACEHCGAQNWIGDDACFLCGIPREPGTKSEAHLYRARGSIFGPLLKRSRRPVPTSVVPVTDSQYQQYLTGTDLLDIAPIREVAESASSLKLETPSEIRGSENRAATKRLLRNADRYRRILLDLGSLRPSGRFDEINPHVLTAFEAFRRMLEEMAQTLVAWSPEDGAEHTSAMQAALDEASNELESASKKMEAAFPGSLEKDSPEERIAGLVVGAKLPSGGELQTLGDLSSMGFDGFEQFMDRGPEGYRYFSDLLTVSLDDLPDEVPPALYLLALLLNDLEDPVGIRRPASLFLDVLRDAYSTGPEPMRDAAVKVQKSLGEAGATLVTLAPQVDALLKTPGLLEDALRAFLIGVYLDLTEGCFKHVTNLLLFAMFVLKGSPRAWEDIADWSTFGEKHQWLKNAGDDPAWVAALDGVEDIVRNSAAHREYELLDAGVRFVQKNLRHGFVEREKVMSNEEFGELVSRLVRTILALSVAAQLFQCDHIREISSDLYGVETPRAMRPTYLELLLGILGLLEPEITVEGKRVQVRASAAPYRPPATTEEYLKSLFFVQKLYPEAEEAAVDVISRGEWYCSLRAPAKRLDDLIRRPDEAKALAMLLSANISSVGQPERSDEEKLTDLGLSLGSRIVVLRLQKTVQLLAHPAGHPDLDEKLSQAVSFLKGMEEALLVPLEVSPEVKRQRAGFVEALKEVRQFFSTVLRVRKGRFGDHGAIGRAENRYVKALDRINRLVNTLPLVERVF